MTEDVEDVEAALAALAVPAPAAVRSRALVGVGLAEGVLRRDHPLGAVCVAWSDLGVARVALVDDPERFAADVVAALGRPVEPVEPPSALLDALDRTFSTGERFALPVDWRGTSPFQRSVLEVAATIPPGEMRPYGWVAERIGHPGAARAVGSALARNPVPLVLPCHRVGRADGSVGSYLYGSEAKARLLRHEAGG